jgi:hypothetical protein
VVIVAGSTMGSARHKNIGRSHMRYMWAQAWCGDGGTNERGRQE